MLHRKRNALPSQATLDVVNSVRAREALFLRSDRFQQQIRSAANIATTALANVELPPFPSIDHPALIALNRSASLFGASTAARFEPITLPSIDTSALQILTDAFFDIPAGPSLFDQLVSALLPSAELKRTLEQARRLAEEVFTSPALDAIRRAFEEGTFLGDFDRVESASFSDSERYAAAERLAEQWLRKPLHNARWGRALPALQSRAADNHTSVREELRSATLQAEFLSASQLDDVPVSHLLRAFRALVANHLSEDLLGPGWRKQHAATDCELDEIPDRMNVEYEAELRALLRQINAEPSLSPTARAVLLARIEGRPLSNAQHQALWRVRHSPPLSTLAAGMYSTEQTRA